MRTTRLTAIAALSLVVVLAACSNDDSKDSAASAPMAGAPLATAAASASAAPAPAAAGNGLVGDGENVKGGPSAPGEPTAPATGTSTIVRGRVATGREDIIKVASITLEVKDVDTARNDAVAAAEAHGATVSSETRAGTAHDKNKTATLVFRVLPTDFDKLVTALGELGEVVKSNTTSEDVTGQVADVEGRIRAAKDAAEKVRALIAKAEKIADLVALEREYAARDAEIQSMSSQLASLKDRAGRSTVSLSIGPLTERPKAAVVEPNKKRETGFMGGLKAGWETFTAAAVVGATVAGALLPFLILAGAVLLVWWSIRRRRPAVVRPADTEPLPTPAT